MALAGLDNNHNLLLQNNSPYQMEAQFPMLFESCPRNRPRRRKRKSYDCYEIEECFTPPSSCGGTPGRFSGLTSPFSYTPNGPTHSAKTPQVSLGNYYNLCNYAATPNSCCCCPPQQCCRRSRSRRRRRRGPRNLAYRTSPSPAVSNQLANNSGNGFMASGTRLTPTLLRNSTSMQFVESDVGITQMDDDGDVEGTRSLTEIVDFEPGVVRPYDDPLPVHSPSGVFTPRSPSDFQSHNVSPSPMRLFQKPTGCSAVQTNCRSPPPRPPPPNFNANCRLPCQGPPPRPPPPKPCLRRPPYMRQPSPSMAVGMQMRGSYGGSPMGGVPVSGGYNNFSQPMLVTIGADGRFYPLQQNASASCPKTIYLIEKSFRIPGFGNRHCPPKTCCPPTTCCNRPPPPAEPHTYRPPPPGTFPPPPFPSFPTPSIVFPPSSPRFSNEFFPPTYGSFNYPPPSLPPQLSFGYPPFPMSNPSINLDVPDVPSFNIPSPPPETCCCPLPPTPTCCCKRPSQPRIPSTGSCCCCPSQRRLPSSTSRCCSRPTSRPIPPSAESSYSRQRFPPTEYSTCSRPQPLKRDVCCCMKPSQCDYCCSTNSVRSFSAPRKRNPRSGLGCSLSRSPRRSRSPWGSRTPSPCGRGSCGRARQPTPGPSKPSSCNRCYRPPPPPGQCRRTPSCDPCCSGSTFNPFAPSTMDPDFRRSVIFDPSCNPCSKPPSCSPCSKPASCNPCSKPRSCNPCSKPPSCNPCSRPPSCSPCSPSRRSPCNDPCGGRSPSYMPFSYSPCGSPCNDPCSRSPSPCDPCCQNPCDDCCSCPPIPKPCPPGCTMVCPDPCDPCPQPIICCCPCKKKKRCVPEEKRIFVKQCYNTCPICDPCECIRNQAACSCCCCGSIQQGVDLSCHRRNTCMCCAPNCNIPYRTYTHCCTTLN